MFKLLNWLVLNKENNLKVSSYSKDIKLLFPVRLVLVDCPIVATCLAELSVLAAKFNLIQEQKWKLQLLSSFMKLV